MRPAFVLAALAATVLSSAPASATSIVPSGEQLDLYALENSPDLRCNMDSHHLLGVLGFGQIEGVPVYSSEILGLTHWDRRFYWSFNLGGVMVSPRVLGVARPTTTSQDRGPIGINALDGQLGLNLIGVRGDSIGYEPLFDLNGRLYFAAGLGAAAGWIQTTDSESGARQRNGIGVTLGPVLGLRYKLMDWHNLNVYARYMYGLNRAVDSYEAAIHGSLGRNVIEIGYRGGAIGTYMDYATSTAGTMIPNAPDGKGYGSWFIRFSQGY